MKTTPYIIALAALALLPVTQVRADDTNAPNQTSVTPAPPTGTFPGTHGVAPLPNNDRQPEAPANAGTQAAKDRDEAIRKDEARRRAQEDEAKRADHQARVEQKSTPTPAEQEAAGQSGASAPGRSSNNTVKQGGAQPQQQPGVNPPSTGSTPGESGASAPGRSSNNTTKQGGAPAQSGNSGQ